METVRPAIAVTGITKRYGTRLALQDLTLAIPQGSVFALLGPNGAGKTTAMKILLGLVRSTAGSGTLLGAPLGDLRVRRRIGYLPELFRAPAWMTVRRVLEFHCALARVQEATWTASIRAVLDAVRLTDRAADRVGALSRGLHQRLGLAAALVAEPDLLLLDEPTAGLDPAERHRFRELIGRTRARGATVLLNTHLLGEAEAVCDRLAVLSRGRVAATGPLTEFLGAGGPAGARSLEARYLELVGDS